MAVVCMVAGPTLKTWPYASFFGAMDQGEDWASHVSPTVLGVKESKCGLSMVWSFMVHELDM